MVATKKWILKKEMAEILKTYSTRKNEFVQHGDNEYSYQSKYVKGYMITFAEELNGEFKTGRIRVSHTQSDGKISFIDIWEHDKENNFQFRFRNPLDRPPCDIDYIKDLEEENGLLKKIIAELKEQKEVFQKLNTDTNINEEHEKEINKLKEELRETKEHLTEINSQKLKSDSKLIELQKELEMLKTYNARGAGRKVSAERQNAINQVKELMERGNKDKAIMKKLGVSPATFYRYKKELLSKINN